MSTATTESRDGHDHPLPGVRTFRGRTVEDLIPQIRAELGPDAIILREREGVMGGLGGFFAQRCVEIEARAAARIDVYDDEHDYPQQAAPSAPNPGQPTPAGPYPDPSARFDAPVDAGDPAPAPSFATSLRQAEVDAAPVRTPRFPDRDRQRGARVLAEADVLAAAKQTAQMAVEAAAQRQAEEAAEAARIEAEEAAEAARIEAEEAAEAARIEAEEAACLDAEEVAGREAEEAARLEAEDAARREEELIARREAEETARREAEETARREAEETARSMQHAAEEAARLAQQAVEEVAARAAERDRQLTSDYEARLATEREARLAAERQVALATERGARVAAERQAALATERGARVAAERQAAMVAERAELPTNPVPPVVATPAVKALAGKPSGDLATRPAPGGARRRGGGLFARWREPARHDGEWPPVAPPAPVDLVAVAAIVTELTGRGISEQRARQLTMGVIAHRAPFESGSDIRDAARLALAASLPASPALPAAGAAIAIVGAGGSGKTRCVAALATAYARASNLPVSVASLGRRDRAKELQHLLAGENVRVIDAKRSRAVDKARARGLLILDTAGVAPGDEPGLASLRATLQPLGLDGVYVTLPATLSARAGAGLLASFAVLEPAGIAVTHLDETDQLGVAVELALAAGVPLTYLHEGVELTRAITPADPSVLATRLLGSERVD